MDRLAQVEVENLRWRIVASCNEFVGIGRIEEQAVRVVGTQAGDHLDRLGIGRVEIPDLNLAAIVLQLDRDVGMVRHRLDALRRPVDILFDLLYDPPCFHVNEPNVSCRGEHRLGPGVHHTNRRATVETHRADLDLLGSFIAHLEPFEPSLTGLAACRNASAVPISSGVIAACLRFPSKNLAPGVTIVYPQNSSIAGEDEGVRIGGEIAWNNASDRVENCRRIAIKRRTLSLR